MPSGVGVSPRAVPCGPPKARSAAVPCHVGLAGTVYMPQIAPRQQGWHWGISLLPLHPSPPFRKGIPRPVWPWGARQEGSRSPAHRMLGSTGRMTSEGRTPALALLWRVPPFSGSSFEGVGVLVRLWGVLEVCPYL